tara:strand:- start:367 stop:639 length:273 start_codon:yes stop_codon:yes gene_type:complete
MKKDYFTICEKFINKHRTGNTDDLIDLLDTMLGRIAVEVVQAHLPVKVPVERLFEHLKAQIKLDIDIKQGYLKDLEKVELIKILKGNKKP